MKLRGADIVLEVIKEQNIDTVFGYPGGTVASLYDALYKNRKYIKHIRTAHEQSAGHGADGYARITGKASVCITTSGPGATNIVTAIATAYADSTPVVFITANVAVSQIGTDSFQEVDITGITIPITKYSKMVKNVDELEAELKKAFLISQQNRKGPVLIDIPQDVLESYCEYKNIEVTIEKKETINIENIDKALELIEKAERPVILAGGGVRISNASRELYKFAKLTNAPVCLTMMALGEYPCYDMQYLGNAGVFETDSVKKAIEECDLLIAVGSRFSNKTDISEKMLNGKNILHIDSDRAEINKNIQSSAYLVGDAKYILSLLNERLEKIPENKEKKDNLVKWIQNNKANCYINKTFDTPFEMKYIIEKISEKRYFDTVVTDVGLHQIITAVNYKFEKHGSFIASGGLGTMGFGIGASIGVYEGSKGNILLVTGDGSFEMESQELITLKRYDIPITILIMNNGQLGMVKSIQDKKFGRRHFETIIKKSDVSFTKLGKAYGIQSGKAANFYQLFELLERFSRSGKPGIIDCRVRK